MLWRWNALTDSLIWDRYLVPFRCVNKVADWTIVFRCCWIELKFYQICWWGNMPLWFWGTNVFFLEKSNNLNCILTNAYFGLFQENYAIFIKKKLQYLLTEIARNFLEFRTFKQSTFWDLWQSCNQFSSYSFHPIVQLFTKFSKTKGIIYPSVHFSVITFPFDSSSIYQIR